MTAAQRMEHRRVWLAWAERAQQELGVLLAGTIGVEPPASDSLYEAVNHMIAAEQTLTALLGK
jgi:hypothetical protein